MLAETYGNECIGKVLPMLCHFIQIYPPPLLSNVKYFCAYKFNRGSQIAMQKNYASKTSRDSNPMNTSRFYVFFFPLVFVTGFPQTDASRSNRSRFTTSTVLTQSSLHFSAFYCFALPHDYGLATIILIWLTLIYIVTARSLCPSLL